jgi:superfamily II DNA or RNA helicase
MAFTFKKFHHTLILALLLIASCSHQTKQTHHEAEWVSRAPAATAYGQACGEILNALIRSTPGNSAGRSLTKIESQLFSSRPDRVLSREEKLRVAIGDLEKLNAELAVTARTAMAIFERGGARALRADLSQLSQKSLHFLEGPYKRIVGEKGLSRVFMDIREIDSSTLLIHHLGDEYPIIVRWGDVGSPQVSVNSRETFIGAFSEAAAAEIKGYQVLTIPGDMQALTDLRPLWPEVNSLISGSRLNRNILARDVPTMRFKALLYDGVDFYDRPTQAEFRLIRDALDTDEAFRAQVKSMLFVAPTGVGKTNILAQNINSKIKRAQKMLVENPQGPKKMSMLMANTADLVDQLSRNIGGQLADQVGHRNFRLIQWGGLNSEQMSVDQLIRFIEESDVPVVLVSSFQTVASRISSDSDMMRLMRYANSLSIDEAHNSGGQTYRRAMSAAMEVAVEDRAGRVAIEDSLDILGVTATPTTGASARRTVELFDYTYWGGVNTPGRYVYRVKQEGSVARSTHSSDVLEWYRINQQRESAIRRGEITSPAEFTYFRPRDNGHQFESIFTTRGSHPYVDLARLERVWPQIAQEVDAKGAGIIHTYPRDASGVAERLRKVSGKNYIAINEVSARERDVIYDSFRRGVEYRGSKIDGLVIGRTKLEGLDFPDAGWYVSLKKYDRFPDNIQASGRVVRIALDKPKPSIIFFSENTGMGLYREVKDFILKKMGRLPNKMIKGRGFIGARRFESTHPGSRLGESTYDLNTALELLFRQNRELSREFQETGAVKAEAIVQLRHQVSDLLRGRGNKEASDSLRRFVNEVSAYPFFRGTLDETWTYADRLIRLERQGRSSARNLSELDKLILANKKLMDDVKEFRALRNWIGNVGREIIEGVDMRPNGVYAFADTMDSFALRYGDQTASLVEHWTLRDDFHTVMQASSGTLWNRLGAAARTHFDTFFREVNELPFEEGLSDFVRRNDALPDFYFDKLGEGHALSALDKASHRIASQLEARIKSGRLFVSELDPDVLARIDQSDMIAKISGHATSSIRSELETFSEAGLTLGRRLSFEELASPDGIGVYRVINELAEMGYENSINARETIRQLLSEF